MAVTLEDLDAAINTLTEVDANLASAVQTVVNDVNTLLAKIAASPSAPDFQAEVDKVSAASQAAQSAVDALKSADLSANPPQA